VLEQFAALAWFLAHLSFLYHRSRFINPTCPALLIIILERRKRCYRAQEKHGKTISAMFFLRLILLSWSMYLLIGRETSCSLEDFGTLHTLVHHDRQ
jgi:hypothetical protein